jgi:hypothetical protein
MAVTMNAFHHVMHAAEGRVDHVSEARLLKGPRVPHTAGMFEVKI